jgi:hypothetical protein
MQLATERAGFSRAGAVVAVMAALAAVAGAGCRGPKSTAATVRGRVVVAAGTPAEVKVALLTAGRAGEPAAAVVAAPDGTFALPAVAPGLYLLRAEAQGYLPAGVSLALQPGESVTTVLRIEPAQRLTGIIQDRQGRALAGAAIFAFPAGGSRVGVVEAASRKDGHFALALAAGAWTLMVEAPGFATLQLDRVSVPGRALVLRLEGEARSLGGMVVGEGGAGEPEARVLLGGAALPSTREARTDAKGLFLFHGLGAGRFVVRAVAADGKRATAVRGVTIDEGTGWLPPMKLELAAGGAIAGKVVDDRGQPLAGAEVDIGSTPTDDLPEVARSDAQGAFALGPLAPGRYRASARSPGHAGAGVPEIVVRAGATTTIELRLARGAEVGGVIVGEQARPLAGATITVTALDAGVHDFAVLSGRLPPAAEAAGLPAEALHRPGRRRAATSDERGRFQVADLPPGRVRIDVSASGRLPLRKDGIVLEPGRSTDLGRIELGAAIALLGRALDEAGAAVSGARIEARRVGSAAGTAFSAVAGEDGAFTLPLPAGRWRVVAHAPGRAPAAVEPVEVGASSPAPIELRLAIAGATLEGSVRDPAGRGIAGATVSAFPLRAGVSADGAPAPADAFPIAAARSDASGRFRLRGVPASPLYVEARHPAWPTLAVAAPPGAEVVLQPPRPGGIEGDVRDAATGAFVNAYRIDALGPDGRKPAEVRWLGAGFELRGLAPGRWRLSVRAEGYPTVERVLDVPAGAAHEPISVHDVRIEVLRPGSQPRPHDAAPPPGHGSE